MLTTSMHIALGLASMIHNYHNVQLKAIVETGSEIIRLLQYKFKG
jgi:hypothetical protein